MASVTIGQVHKYFGRTHIIQGVSVDIADGEFCVLVGPSGCGKSTLLRMIAGLEEISGGDIFIGDKRVNDMPPKERDIAMVFQNYALYPHMTVRDNMAFSLLLAKQPAQVIAERVDVAAGILGLHALLDRYPRQLSGGQQSVIRSLAGQPGRCAGLAHQALYRRVFFSRQSFLKQGGAAGIGFFEQRQGRLPAQLHIGACRFARQGVFFAEGSD